VRVNRLLLGNTSVVGAGWGAYVMSKPDVTLAIGAELSKLIDGGFIRPVVGQRFGLEQAGEALGVLARREALGKVVLDVTP
jgi:NADPH:quinone reductase